MAEESELVGGISAELRADHSKLPGDLAAAEKLVQQWAGQVATVQLRAVGKAPAGGAGGGASGGSDAANIARAIEQGFANLSMRSGGRSQPASIPVGAGGAVRGGPPANLPVALQNKISDALGEVEERAVNVTAVVAASARRPRQSTESLAREAVSTSAPHSYNVSARGAYNAPGYNYDISSAGAQGPVHVASSSETFRTQDEAVAAGNVYAQRMAEKIREDLGMAPRREEATRQATAETAAPIAVTATRGRERAAVTEDIRHEETQRVASVRRVAAAETQVRRQTKRTTVVDDEEEGGLTGMTRRAAFAMAEEERAGARIQSARVRTGRQAYNESERQRRTELNATHKHYDSLADLAERYFDAQANRLGGMEASGEKAESQQRLRELTHEQQRVGAGGPPPSATLAPQRTPAQVAAFREEEAGRTAARREEEARRTTAAASAPRVTPRPGLTAPVAPALRPVDEIERARRRALAEINDRGRVGRGGAGGSDADFRRSDEEIERRQQLRVAQGESQRLTAARTSRTFAAGLGGFSPLGTARQQLEANAGLTASNEKVAVSQRRLNDPAIIRNPRAYRQATEELTVALKERAMWTEKIEKLATGGTALRTLAAVTVAGAAFGLAMQGVSVAVDLVGKAVSPTLERLTGFAAATASYTDQLSDATRAASGNAQAVTALKLAATGLSSTTAATIQPLIQQRAEIEAGNKAITEQIEAFHVSENLRKQGAGAGLGGGTGGFLGTGLLGVPGTGEQIGNLLRQQGDAARFPRSRAVEGTGLLPGILTPRYESQQIPQEEEIAAFARSLGYVNEQLVKGGAAADRFSQASDDTDERIDATARAFDQLSPAMAAAIRENNLYAESIRDTGDAARALKAINIAGQLPDPALLQQQFNRQNPALINAAARQQQFAANIQLPAQQALQNLATPLKPVGTGFAAANAEEQRRVADTQKESIQLQDQLNERYERGVEILENTYKVPPQLLNQIKAVGQQIAGIQASISNEQAAYQTAQYNYQLGIAKRTLSDIGGLTGKNFGAGQSYLGQLEKENLALSRQGQQLQFNLSQRSINFQRAVAGFTAPGLTPEERAARIEQANIEADIAQKQLDIGKNIFQNQVQIVDIQNLRAGADLVKQIALLEQGRAVTIDVQVKTEELERLIAIQQQQVAEAGTYIAQVESLVQAAFGQIQQLEVAAGAALAGIANKVLEQFGLTLNGINGELEEFAERTNYTTPEERPGRSGGARSVQGTQNEREYASGIVGRTQGKTSITVGDAGGEEVAVLSNPRAYLGGGGGSQSVSVVFTGEITVRSEDDLRKMEQFVESAVVRALGRGSSLQGLRLS